ncbi:MAG: hypothetical protein ACR2QF_06955 [Geminicoccaceae bacterium]
MILVLMIASLGIYGAGTAEAPVSENRIIENGEDRLTESGEQRLTEGS